MQRYRFDQEDYFDWLCMCARVPDRFRRVAIELHRIPFVLKNPLDYNMVSGCMYARERYLENRVAFGTHMPLDCVSWFEIIANWIVNSSGYVHLFDALMDEWCIYPTTSEQFIRYVFDRYNLGEQLLFPSLDIWYELLDTQFFHWRSQLDRLVRFGQWDRDTQSSRPTDFEAGLTDAELEDLYRDPMDDWDEDMDEDQPDEFDEDFFELLE